MYQFSSGLVGLDVEGKRHLGLMREVRLSSEKPGQACVVGERIHPLVPLVLYLYHATLRGLLPGTLCPFVCICQGTPHVHNSQQPSRRQPVTQGRICASSHAALLPGVHWATIGFLVFPDAEALMQKLSHWCLLTSEWLQKVRGICTLI